MPARRAGAAAALGLMMAVTLTLGGCAGSPSHGAVGQPDDSLLAPAQNAIARAVKKNWSNGAPAIMNAARARLTRARSIVYQAASKNRDLTGKERQRVKALVAAVKLDVRAAKARGEAVNTQTRVAALEGSQGQTRNNHANNTSRHTLKASQSKSRTVAQPTQSKHNGASPAPRRRPPASGTGVQQPTPRPMNSGGIGG